MTVSPESLFVATDEAAVPVDLVTQSGFEPWLATKSDAEQRWIKLHGFTAVKGSVATWPATQGGLGGAALGFGGEDATMPDIWAFAALADALPEGTYKLADPLIGESAQHAALGWGLAQYRFDKYRKSEKIKGPKILVLPDGQDQAEIEAALKSLYLVRDLVNTPTENMGPGELAQAALALGAGHDAKVRVVEGPSLLTEGFPAIHAVGRAAATPPLLIDLRWGRPDAPKVTLVGKGVCFDSGGLDIKPASGMRWMKKDMGGAAHVLGLAHWLMASGIDIRLRVLIPAVENAISGNAFRPGDILDTRAGISVEVTNTDAEGRLVLSDALTLAGEERPDLVIDFATLTGAARVALGADVPAMFTPDHEVAGQLAVMAARQGDPLWRLPLYAPYLEDLKSSVADTLNAAENGLAGAITAALFLQRFTEACGTWVHFDIFAFNQRSRPGRPQGGEAMALRTVYHYLHDRYGVAAH